MKTPRRFFLYSHDGQGLGHARRHLAIARGIVEADPTASVLIATGIEELPKPGLPRNVEVLKLPSLRKMANGRYESRRLLLAPRETRSLRSSLLLAAVKVSARTSSSRTSIRSVPVANSVTRSLLRVVWARARRLVCATFSTKRRLSAASGVRTDCPVPSPNITTRC